MKYQESIPYLTPVTKRIFKEHVIRYRFASAYVKNKRVLDMACGTGYGSEMLKNAGALYVRGVDISEEAISFAKQKYSKDGIEFSVGNAEYFNSGCYDAIVSFETIEHVEDYKKVLRNFYTILDPGGILIISTPNRPVTSPQAKNIYDKPSNPSHVREFTLPEFTEVLQKTGFNFSEEDIFGQSDFRRFKNDYWRKFYKLFKLVTKWTDPGYGPEVKSVSQVPVLKIIVIKAKK